MFKRRSFRRSRSPKGSPYEMQQFSFSRVPMTMTDGDFTPVNPFQFLTCIVSPREEHATIFDAADAPPVPANAMGVVVGGIRFYLRFDVNFWAGVSPALTIATVATIKSALVVLPLDPVKAQTPLTGTIVPNLLAQQGVQVEDPTGSPTTTYQRPRILWRGLDALRLVGQEFDANGSGHVIRPFTMSDIVSGIQFSEHGSVLNVVKSKVRLGMDQALYLLHEVALGFSLAENQAVNIATSVFGVAAVKRLTRGQGRAA